jgi:hypothetical protein
MQLSGVFSPKTDSRKMTMSGRKDFSVGYSNRRARQELEGVMARAVDRAAAIRVLQERLSAIRRHTQTELDQLADEQTRRFFDEQIARRRAVLEELKKAAERNLVEIQVVSRSADPVVAPGPCDKQPNPENQLPGLINRLSQWKHVLEASDEVRDFCGQLFLHWLESIAPILNSEDQSRSSKDRLIAAQEAILEAERLQATAIETSDKFEQRNAVIVDILDSLQEIGFFVNDPQYADPARPDLPVIIRATRADQTMVATVSLNAVVESDWQGVHGEHCTDAFFQYAQSMKARGIELTPATPHLIPNLRTQGAVELPGSIDQPLGRQENV